jgi:hypothetical protein
VVCNSGGKLALGLFDRNLKLLEIAFGTGQLGGRRLDANPEAPKLFGTLGEFGVLRVELGERLASLGFGSFFACTGGCERLLGSLKFSQNFCEARIGRVALGDELNLRRF